jgi:hypothetical protein
MMTSEKWDLRDEVLMAIMVITRLGGFTVSHRHHREGWRTPGHDTPIDLKQRFRGF